MKCLVPRDFIEFVFIQQVQVETWHVMRYTRHQSLGIERRFRQSLEFQTQRIKETKARREAIAREIAEKAGRPVSELSRLINLEEAVSDSLFGCDEILERAPNELDHNRALDQGMDFHVRMDRLINSAQARRNEALEWLEHYRASMGTYWRLFSDELIEARRLFGLNGDAIRALQTEPERLQLTQPGEESESE